MKVPYGKKQKYAAKSSPTPRAILKGSFSPAHFRQALLSDSASVSRSAGHEDEAEVAAGLEKPLGEKL